MRTIILCAVILAAMLPALANARVVEDLTSARVPVADRSDIEFARATSKALEAVLVKLTGNSSTPKTAAGRAVLSRAKRLIQQFGYERPRAGSGSPDQLVLRVEFDSQALSDEMRARNLVVWGKERPETLVLVAVNDDTGPRVLGDGHALLEIFRDRARRRAIPMVYPSAELAAVIEPATTPGALLDSFLAAGAGITVDTVAVGVFDQPVPGLWETRWLVSMGESKRTFEHQGDIVELIAEEAVESLADTVGLRYADPALLANRSEVEIRVLGVENGIDFARVESYLNELDAVEQLFIDRVDSDRLYLRMIVQGGYAGLSQSIAFGSVLAPDVGGAGEFRLIAP